MIKLYMGGSPCTHWSIAQTKTRETEPSGIGWELFKNYLIGLEKYNPTYFLYENNKSMAPAIREQITKELGVEPILINSALVSAQNRQRLYWTNIPGIMQPVDRGILLRDVLESGVSQKGYCFAEPAALRYERTEKAKQLRKAYESGAVKHGYHEYHELHPRQDGKSNTVTTVLKDNMIIEPIRIGTIESNAKNADFDSQQYRVYSPDGKSVTLCGNGGGIGAKTGLYAVPHVIKSCRLRGRNGEAKWEVRGDDKANVLDVIGARSATVFESWDGKTYPVYEVCDGLITIKDKQYPIKLPDGFYIIRKLTVTECKRLQTVPDSYIFPVSDSQAYKMLGNGWTVDVIAHILSHVPDITTVPVEVLSMYDGMSGGHIALDKLGANVVRYMATEIDKYAIKTTMENYPATVHLGDAFQVRDEGWRPNHEAD